MSYFTEPMPPSTSTDEISHSERGGNEYMTTSTFADHHVDGRHHYHQDHGEEDNDDDELDEDDEYSYVTVTSPLISIQTVTTPSLSEVTMDDLGERRRAKKTKRDQNSFDEVQMLMLQLQQKKLEMDQLRREHRLTLSQAEDEREQEKHNIEIERMRLTARLKQYERQMHDIKQQTESEVNSLQSKHAKLKRERQTTDEQMEEIKKSISSHGGPITETQHLKWKGIPQSELSLIQFVQMHIFERVRDYEQKCEDLMHQNTVLLDNNRHTSSELDKIKREHEHLKRTNGESEESFKALNEDLKRKLKETEEELDNYQMQWTQFQERNEMLEMMQTDLRSSTAKSHELESQSQFLEKRIKAAQVEHSKLQNEVSSMNQQIQLLQKDKIYLTKDGDALKLQLEQLRHEYEQQSVLVEEQKKQKEQLQDQLLSITIQTKTESVQEREEAISKIHEQTKHDLQKIKKNARENYERELRILREGKQHSTEQSEKLSEQLREARSDYDALLADHRSLQQNAENQLNELRSHLKLKAFENERMTAAQVEITNNLNTCKQEVQVLLRKLDVTKTAFYTLQNDTGKRIAELEARKESMERELHNYHKLEDELDRAVDTNAPLFEDEERHFFSQSHHGSDGKPVTGGNGTFSPTAAMTTFPTNATRRLKYSIYLARRVSQLETHIQELSTSIRQKDSDIESLGEQLKRSNAKLDKTSQPYNFLVSAIESRELDIGKKEKHIALLEKDLCTAQRNSKQLRKEREVLQQDLQSMLQQKSSFAELKSVLVKMRRDLMVKPKRSKSPNDNADDDIKSAVQNLRPKGSRKSVT